MRREPPLPQELWNRIPPDIQAAIWVRVEGYERRMAVLEAEVAGLKERLDQNSRNLTNLQNRSIKFKRRSPDEAQRNLGKTPLPGFR